MCTKSKRLRKSAVESLLLKGRAVDKFEKNLKRHADAAKEDFLVYYEKFVEALLDTKASRQVQLTGNINAL